MNGTERQNGGALMRDDTDSAGSLCGQHRPRRGDRRECADPHDCGRRTRGRRSRRVRARAGSQSDASSSWRARERWYPPIWARPLSRAASIWAGRSSSISVPSWTGISRRIACFLRCCEPSARRLRFATRRSPQAWPLPSDRIWHESTAGTPFQRARIPLYSAVK